MPVPVALTWHLRGCFSLPLLVIVALDDSLELLRMLGDQVVELRRGLADLLQNRLNSRRIRPQYIANLCKLWVLEDRP